MTNPNPLLPRDQPLEPVLPDDLTVKLIGLGGTGGIIARYGVKFLAYLAQQQESNVRFVAIEGDSFEPGNAPRMFFSRYGNKAVVTLDDLAADVADSRLSLEPIEEYVTPDNVDRLLRERDKIILAVDRHASRKLISDYCAEYLNDVVLISVGNDGIGKDSSGKVRRGTFGNCQIYIKEGGKDVTPTLTAFHLEIEKPADELPNVPSCTLSTASTPQLLMANLAAASAALNALLLYLSGVLHYSELVFDIADGLMQPLPLPASNRRDSIVARDHLSTG